MKKKRDDILGRLESAVDDWNEQVAGAHTDLSDQLARARDQLGAAADSVAGNAGEGAAQTIQLVMERCRAAADATSEGVGQLLEAVKELQVDLRTAHIEAFPGGQDTGALAGVRTELAALREQLEEIAILGPEVRRLRELVEAESETLEWLRSMGFGQAVTNEGVEVTEALARALKERDEAYREVAEMRAEVQALRGPAAVSASMQEEPSDLRPLMLGELLVEAGSLSFQQLTTALSVQRESPHRRIGSILVSSGYVAESDVDAALAYQVNRGAA
jgi:hypothetical protein